MRIKEIIDNNNNNNDNSNNDNNNNNNNNNNSRLPTPPMQALACPPCHPHKYATHATQASISPMQAPHPR